MKTRIFNIILTIILCCLGIATWAVSQDVAINNVVITKYQNNVYVYFTLEGPYSAELEEAIKSGIETTFTFYVVLTKHRGGILSDPEIVERTIKHTVKYDTLLQSYTIIREEEGEKPLVTKDFEEVKRIMAQVRFYPLVTLTMLERGETYRILIKGKLDKASIPKSLSYILFFTKIWDFETPWYVEEFSY